MFTGLLADRLTDWLWLAGWLAGWLKDWSIRWLIGWLTDLLNGWLTDWIVYWLASWQTDWLTDWVGWLKDWQTDWLTGWLAGWQTDWLSWLAGWQTDWQGSIHSAPWTAVAGGPTMVGLDFDLRGVSRLGWIIRCLSQRERESVCVARGNFFCMLYCTCTFFHNALPKQKKYTVYYSFK